VLLGVHVHIDDFGVAVTLDIELLGHEGGLTDAAFAKVALCRGSLLLHR
jgi:hypothetical protein